MLLLLAGVFLYELASSALATAFAAFMPIIGSPHHGFHTPHRGGPVPFFGLWGRTDDSVPPIANLAVVGHPGDMDVAVDTRWGGYLYVTAGAVFQQWAATNGCGNASRSALGGSRRRLRWASMLTRSVGWSGCESAACKIAEASGSACVGWSASTCDDGAAVIKCIHPGGHSAPAWAPEALFAFMQEHPGRREMTNDILPPTGQAPTSVAAMLLGLSIGAGMLAMICGTLPRRCKQPTVAHRGSKPMPADRVLEVSTRQMIERVAPHPLII